MLTGPSVRTGQARQPKPRTALREEAQMTHLEPASMRLWTRVDLATDVGADDRLNNDLFVRAARVVADQVCVRVHRLGEER